MDERREYLRISCKLEVESESGGKWFVLYSSNIGMDGIMLVCESGLGKLKKVGIEQGKKVFLSFYLSDSDEVTKIYGQILTLSRKMDPIEKQENSYINIQFKDVSEETNKQVESFVRKRQKVPPI